MELTNRLDATTIAARVAAGRLDPAEVVAAFQARIAARNDQLNAVFEQRQELVDADLAQLRLEILRNRLLAVDIGIGEPFERQRETHPAILDRVAGLVEQGLGLSKVDVVHLEALSRIERA
jgi:hypothetical protein